jgi:hypothetical protein
MSISATLRLENHFFHITLGLEDRPSGFGHPPVGERNNLGGCGEDAVGKVWGLAKLKSQGIYVSLLRNEAKNLRESRAWKPCLVE